MKRWWVLIALLLSLGVNIGVLASLAVGRLGQEPPSPPASRPARFEGGPPNLRILADRLGLDGQEREEFLRLQRRFFDTVRTNRSRLVRLRRELHQEMMRRDPDPQRLDALLSQLGETQAGMERTLVRTVLDSRQFLDPERERRYMRFLASHMRPGPQGPPRPPRRRPGPP